MIFVYYFYPIKFAKRLNFQENVVHISEFENDYVSLICIPTQVTGAWFKTYGIIIDNKAYYFGSYGFEVASTYDLGTSGNDPWFIVRDRFTIYSYEDTNQFILSGILQKHVSGEYIMEVDTWDMVYPIKSLMRNPIKWFYLTRPDFR